MPIHPDPRILAYADLCWAVALAGVVVWFDLVGEALAETRPTV